MYVNRTFIDDLLVIEPSVFLDNRGFFFESYNRIIMKEKGLDIEFVQDNHSRSMKNTLRGIHFQDEKPQGKLVRVVNGDVFDVAVDLRKDSKTFGKWYGLILSDSNKKMFYIPPGFGHGFLVLSDVADFLYKTTDYYYPEYENGIIWNDKTIRIEWPSIQESDLIMSDKDKNRYSLSDWQDVTK